MNMKPKQWDIWLARVGYEDSQAEKIRPVLILDDSCTAVIVSLKMTSQPPREGVWGEYRMEHWLDSGLKKPTVIRCSKVLYLGPEAFVHKIGILHPADLRKVWEILGTPYK